MSDIIQKKSILQNIIFLNRMRHIIYGQLIKKFINENDKNTKTKLLAAVVFEYDFFEKNTNSKEYNIITRWYNGKSTVLKSLNQIKEFSRDIVNSLFEAILDSHGGSSGFFIK